MGVIIGQRRTEIEDAAARAEAFAPHLWQHRRQMLWWRKMNALDQETAKKVLQPMGTGGFKSWEWISSIPYSVATVLSQTRPEIFFDRTGKAAIEFLKSEEGAPYRVPGNRIVPT